MGRLLAEGILDLDVSEREDKRGGFILKFYGSSASQLKPRSIVDYPIL